MKRTIYYLMIAFTVFLFSGCKEEGPMGPAGQDGLNATVYYSEWFSPDEWMGVSGDWYFEASAPDLTSDIVENGVILAYVWLADDLYEGYAIRPLPAIALGANWSFLIPDYKYIVFNTDMVSRPLTSENKFRFIAIPGTIPSLKSASALSTRKEELQKLTYQQVCKLYNIPE